MICKQVGDDYFLVKLYDKNWIWPIGGGLPNPNQRMILKEKTNITKMEMLDIIIDERYFQRERESGRERQEIQREENWFSFAVKN